MTQTCELTTLTIPGRRRPSTALPVLISIPNIAPAARARRPRPRARRRLRREVRAVGYALLVIMPLSMAFATFGGDKLPPLASNRIAEDPATSAEGPTRRASVISLAPLEPVVTVQGEFEAPVFLPGYLLPADTPEESSDGGH
jgi:hypothetical protein